MSKFGKYTLLSILILILIPAVAFAADGKTVSSLTGNNHILSGGTGMGTLFDVKLIEISKGIIMPVKRFF